MLVTKDNIPTFEEIDPMWGKGHLTLEHAGLALKLPQSVGALARATLAPGAEVGYHVHDTDSEVYYFLSGVGEYTEGDTHYRVGPGDASYTAIGEGHGIKNIGESELVFIALTLN